MKMENQTTVTEFIFLGLSSDPQMQIFLFLVFLVIYLITLGGNIVIMVVIRADCHLHTPMYSFLFHLSIVDICYSSVTVPNMLKNFLAERKTISVIGCIAQMFFILLSAATEAFILSAMAYDRYAAICDPLRYMDTMSTRICVQLVSGAWAIGFFHALLNTVFALKLHFCGPNQIHHFSCELPLLLQLSCTDTLTNQVVLLTSAVILGSSSFVFSLISYIHIISTILRIHSVEGRRKAFSTCSSHLIVVGLLYLTGFLQYTKPSSVSSVVLDEIFSIQYSVLTPMLNPIIYSLKNKEVKTALRKMLGKFKFLR
ncbi:olfactory receptor 1009-like [Malaclemys terrapin pileata]|uniref:olfactory receptor 1009-like n=1 Tax=Malaclemys terrapin pileata TaxID=2991368 RepID=UPI0023A8D5CD|nr:olfactory receptor 1009-like [Malaclemys terrapin pileata]